MLEVDAGALAYSKGFCGGRHNRLADEVVQQLDRVPCAWLAHMENVFCTTLEHGLNLGKSSLGRADHDVQTSSLGFDRRACQRRIDKHHAFAVRKFAQVGGGVGLTRRAIDDDQTCFGIAQQTAGASHHSLDLRRTRHTNQDDVAARAQGGRVVGQGGASV